MDTTNSESICYDSGALSMDLFRRLTSYIQSQQQQQQQQQEQLNQSIPMDHLTSTALALKKRIDEFASSVANATTASTSTNTNTSTATESGANTPVDETDFPADTLHKPPYSYIALIAMAIKSTPEKKITLNGECIYVSVLINPNFPQSPLRIVELFSIRIIFKVISRPNKALDAYPNWWRLTSSSQLKESTLQLRELICTCLYT